MNIVEAIRIAFRSLWANKLRSVLTLLGVVIGIASVIAVVTFVSGINDYVAKKIFNLGADVFIVSKMSGVRPMSNISWKRRSARTWSSKTTTPCLKPATTAIMSAR